MEESRYPAAIYYENGENIRSSILQAALSIVLMSPLPRSVSARSLYYSSSANSWDDIINPLLLRRACDTRPECTLAQQLGDGARLAISLTTCRLRPVTGPIQPFPLRRGAFRVGRVWEEGSVFPAGRSQRIGRHLSGPLGHLPLQGRIMRPRATPAGPRFPPALPPVRASWLRRAPGPA